MAAKKAIIASNLPSIKEIANENEVLFFKPDNYLDLSKKVNKLLNDDNLNKLLAKNSYEKVKKFTWEKRVQNIVKLYKNE